MKTVDFVSKGNWLKTNSFLERILETQGWGWLDYYGKRGVEALQMYTPIGETGDTVLSWDYVIEREDGVVTLTWTNSNVNNHVNIAIILQYGHASRNGSWVEGYDYINPALQPIFDEMSNRMWMELKR